MDISNIISYFRACYQADNRDIAIWNFFGDKMQKRIVIEGKEELITGFLPYSHIDPEKAQDIQKTLSLYRKEKELIYCSFFIIGKSSTFKDKTRKICSPLFFYPAKIIRQDDIFYIQIDLQKRRLNYSILSTIREKQDDDGSFYETIYNQLPEKIVDVSETYAVSNTLKQYIPDLDTEELTLFPELFSEKKLKRMLQPRNLENQDGFKIVPASGMGLIKKSNDTLGVLNELATIARQNNISKSIHALFGDQYPSEEVLQDEGHVPAVLSMAQKKIMYAASTYPFSLIVGPPGTGKSYTIAALAVEHLSRGKSVLISSRTDQAVDVVADKIENQLSIKNVLIRGGRSDYLRDLKKHLQNLLSGINPYGYVDKKQKRKLHRKLSKNKKHITHIEKEFEKRVEKENRWGKFVFENSDRNNWFTNLKQKFIFWQNRYHRPHWEIINELEQELDKLNRDTISYIEKAFGLQINQTLQKRRSDLTFFSKAIRARTGARQESYFDEICFDTILKTFPIWLVKMSDIYKILPLNKEMFDLAIIDEATQCDIATCIPIMQRAKNVVFAGDPNQLRHVSFLSKARQQILQRKFELDEYNPDTLNYRDRSILDIVGDNAREQSQVVFLDEHFRSTPQIIDFSNRNFYNNALHIMTDKPNIDTTGGIETVDCKGTRNRQGYNAEEAAFVLEKLRQIVDSQKELSQKAVQSIGILSPFRKQTEYISDKVSKNFSVGEIEKHNIAVGTAYSFQGEERDVMFISFALDNASHPTAFYHLNKADVFNVSITRARSVLYLCFSVDIEKIAPDSLFRRYLESAGKLRRTVRKSTAEKDRFLTEVKNELIENGVKVWSAYPVAGMKIDLIAQNSNKIYGIDLIGFPGEFEEAFPLERYKMLNRAGLRTFALPYTYWCADKTNCMNRLLNMINSKSV